MASLTPRSPYTPEELRRLYPKELQLEQVQVILRHGERTPVSARFQNAGLPEHWPYCQAATRLKAAVMSSEGWDALTYRRRIETFGLNDLPVIAAGPNGELDRICQPGELTDPGRASTLALGKRLRNLYATQLSFLPHNLTNPDILYLRSTPIPRALESLQQAITGLYPPSTRILAPGATTLLIPTIITRAAADETLFPNDSQCKRFAQLSAAFAERTAIKWNDSPDMAYLNRKIGKWMPPRSPRVQVDSHPRLSGIMDTINSTLSHGPETRLPSEFYDAKARAIIDKIGVEEWFGGYKENREYRMLGIGGLAGDIVTRMVGHVEKSLEDGSGEVGAIGGESDAKIRFAMSGAHDTTLGALLTSLGAFEGEEWPRYTSHIAVELFKGTDVQPLAKLSSRLPKQDDPNSAQPTAAAAAASQGPWWSPLTYLRRSTTPPLSSSPLSQQTPIGRTPTPSLTPPQQSLLNNYYVRIRYNDRPMTIPGCKPVGKHWQRRSEAAVGVARKEEEEEDASFCTLTAFKEICDKFTPRDWRKACSENLDREVVPERVEVAGF